MHSCKQLTYYFQVDLMSDWVNIQSASSTNAICVFWLWRAQKYDKLVANVNRIDEGTATVVETKMFIGNSLVH